MPMPYTLFYQNCASGNHFVGHSMGGYVAGFAELYPDTIKVGFIKLDQKPIAPNEKSIGPSD
jgi:pimeloyl-ACP methyl ester carboxylesterase